MPDEPDPADQTETGDGTDSVDEAVVAEWVAETTPFERVHEVVRHTYDPQSADEIAQRARVSPTTARKHLRSLVDAGAVVTEEEARTTRYRRSETAIVTEHAQSLLAEQTPEDIAAGVADMKERMREWREEYGVESPEEFARELSVNDADSEHGGLLREWQTIRRNVALAEAALAIADAQERGHLTGSDGDDGGNGDSSIPV